MDKIETISFDDANKKIVIPVHKIAGFALVAGSEATKGHVTLYLDGGQELKYAGPAASQAQQLLLEKFLVLPSPQPQAPASPSWHG
jgi:hypothetical protein